MSDAITYDELHDKFMGAILREGSQKAFADRHGISPSYVNDIVHRRRSISAELAYHSLGYGAVTRYVKVRQYVKVAL